MAGIRVWTLAAGALAVMTMPGGSALAAPVPAASYGPASYGALGHPGWRVADESAYHRRGYTRHRGYYRDRGVDAGDVIAGVLVLGGIAAIASAVSRDADRRREDDRYQRYNEPRPMNTGELNAAADSCAYAAENRLGGDARLGEITSVERDGAGWQVQGTVMSYGRSQGFLCGVTDDRIDYLQMDEAGY